VGTTSVRAMESLNTDRLDTHPLRTNTLHTDRPDANPVHPSDTDRSNTANVGIHGDTRLFITPGYRYTWIDAMITNFHLPQSTLLMLVCAFAGMEPVRRAYDHAVRERYRFFSYGDAMFIEAPHGDAP